MSTVAKKCILNASFKGLPKKSDLKVVEENLPAIKDGGTYVSCLCGASNLAYINCTLPRCVPIV